MRRIILVLLLTIGVTGCQNLFVDEKTAETKPAVLGISPAEMFRGQTDVAQINGTNLAGVTAVNLGDGISVQEITSSTSTEVVVHFSVNPQTGPGPRTISVTTSKGVATNSSLLQVAKNRVPRAAFIVDPPAPVLNGPVLFDASSSTDPDNNIAGYQWDFGDGQSAQGRAVTHKFNTVAAFRVSLKVTDGDGASAVASRELQIKTGAVPEARFFIAPDHGNISTNFKFDAGSSSDRDGRIVDYRWDFGDGTSGSGRVASHTYRSAKRFLVKLQIEDNDGFTAGENRTLRVQSGGGGGGGNPVASFVVTPDPGNVTHTFHFDASASHADGAITQYLWSFGDGNSASGRTTDHKYANSGTYQVLLQVQDSDARTASTTRGFRVNSDPGGGGGTGTQCTTPSRKHEVFMFQVISEDAAARTIVAKFNDPVSCSDVFYLCGDVRVGGIQPGSKEYWIGIICDMYDLGNNTFRIHLVEGKYWVQAGERGTYVWPQSDCIASAHCK